MNPLNYHQWNVNHHANWTLNRKPYNTLNTHCVCIPNSVLFDVRLLVNVCKLNLMNLMSKTSSSFEHLYSLSIGPMYYCATFCSIGPVQNVHHNRIKNKCANSSITIHRTKMMYDLRLFDRTKQPNHGSICIHYNCVAFNSYHLPLLGRVVYDLSAVCCCYSPNAQCTI